jgi:hypothetical protein
MMRRFCLFVLCAAASCFDSSIARAANDGAFKILDWNGRAYWDQDKKERQFDHYTLDRHYMWNFELSNPTWNFPKGAKFDVTLGIGNRSYIRQRVVAIEPQLVRVLLPDSVSAFEALRRIVQLELIAGGLTSRFNLGYSNAVLTALTRCVVRYGSTPKTRAAVAAWLKSSAGATDSAGANPEIQKEAAALAANIVFEAAIPKAVSLKPDDTPAGTSGNAIWKVGDNLFTVSILPRNDAPEIGDLADLIIGADAQKCRGDFFSGAMLDVIDTVGVTRAYTNCATPQATTAVYYFAIPRKRGGLYLLTSIARDVEVTPSGEKSIRDIDSKVRASIMTALSKL